MISEPSFYKTEKERLERVKRIYKTNVEKIEAAKYMGKDEGFELVRYLVSKMEDSEYCISEIPVKYFLMPDETKTINYKLVYLIKKDKKEMVERYLCNKFIFDSSQKVIKFIMDLPCNDYIQIAYYKDTDNKRICFSKDRVCELTKEPNNEIRSYISDSRYTYIVDFMDSIVEYRLEDMCYKIGKDKIYKLADKYITENKKEKKLNLKQNNF